MTPKEKARELFDKFNKGEILYWQVDKFGAIEAALITVDEIINNDGFTRFDAYLTEYWKEVRKEINKL